MMHRSSVAPFLSPAPSAWYVAVLVSATLACSANGGSGFPLDAASPEMPALPDAPAFPDVPALPDVPTVGDTPSAQDVPTPEDVPASPDAPASPCAARVPTGNFCVDARGACNFAPPSLVACDTGASANFYGADFCAARATLVIACAGWDSVCLRVASTITSEVVTPYADRGVRSIVVLYESADRTAPTVSQCAAWRARTFPSVPTYIATAAELGRIFRLEASPSFAIVDARGRLVYVQTGAQNMSIRDALNAVLNAS